MAFQQEGADRGLTHSPQHRGVVPQEMDYKSKGGDKFGMTSLRSDLQVPMLEELGGFPGAVWELDAGRGFADVLGITFCMYNT